MKKLYISHIVLIIVILGFLFSHDLPDIKKESTLILKSPETIANLGEHCHHKFYNIGIYDSEPEGMKGEIVQKYGLMGGSDYIGKFYSTGDGTVTFSAKARKGEMKFLLEKEWDSDKILFDFVKEEETQVSLEEGTYKLYLVGNEFSGACRASYEGVKFECEDAEHEAKVE